MLRKFFLTAALVAAVPAMANATWYISSSVSGSGTITSTDVKQGVGAVALPDTTTYENFTVTPAANYMVTAVRVNGAAITPVGGVYKVNKQTYLQSVVAYFAAQKATVSASVPGGGGAIVADPKTPLTVGSDYTVNIVPYSGYEVADVVVDSADQGKVPSYTWPKITAGSHTITASFVFKPTVSASVSVAGTLSLNKPVTLNGVASTNDTGIASYQFLVNDSATGVVQAKATDNFAYFTPSAPGTYNVSFTATSVRGGTKTATTSFTILAQADANLNACVSCHQNRSDKQVIADFTGSPHWTNQRNFGFSDNAGTVVNTCAVEKCHFRSVATNTSACQTCHSDGLAKNQGANGPTGVLSNYSASGMIGITQEKTCFVCHQGSHHGTPTAAYQKSSHYLNPYGEGVVHCYDCHNAHTTKAEFPSYDPATYKQTAEGSCDKCHVGKYGIFNNDSTMKGSHAASLIGASVSHGPNNRGVATNIGSSNAGWYTGARTAYLNISSSYVTPNTTCTDCHGHNNQVNAEYAETMHGDKYGRWKGTQYFKFRGYSAPESNPSNVGKNDGCVRCHTTTGFVNFVESGFQDLRAWGFQNVNDPTAEVIACRACHVTGKGAITGEAEVGLPEGNVNGWNPASIRAYNKPFTAYYNFSTAATGKLIKPAAFTDYKNSNVCISCHAGRNTATNGEVIKDLKGYANFTTLTAIGGSVPGAPHGVYQSAILAGKIGYQFSRYTTMANGHATLGVGGAVDTGTTAGPCVTCHMATKGTGNAAYRKHSFEIADAKGVVPSVCSSCHSTGFSAANIEEAKANFQAAVSALGQVMATSSNKYGMPIITFTYSASSNSYSVNPADAKRLIPGVSFTGKNTEYADLVGAYYNMKLLWAVAYGSSDEGAFAHNPQYMKQLVYDTIAALAPANTSVATVIAGLAPATATTTGTINPGFTADQQTKAGGYASAALNKHYATANAAGYKVQYMGAGASTCASCHNPAESDLQKAAREAWAESAHGETTGAPWTPSASHAWRSAGDANDFSVNVPANDCLRCHTTDGFVQFTDSGFKNVTPVADAAAAKTNSPLNCNACHTAALGSDNARRVLPAVTTYYNISSAKIVPLVAGTTNVTSHVAASFPDVGDSNLCNSCHTGKITGQNLVDIYNKGADFSKLDFQNPHYLAASGTMYVKAGFTAFSTARGTLNYGDGTSVSSYANSLKSSLDGGAVTSTHRLLGTSGNLGHGIPANTKLNAGGPCVTCHMQGANSGTAIAHRADGGHSLEINQDAITQVCNNCHDAELGKPITNIADFKQYFLEPQSEAYQAALTLAKTVLKQKYNITYSDGYPYFYDDSITGSPAVKDWTRKGALTQLQAMRLHGAALNIKLLSSDSAAYAHARTYSRRLLFDTIDYLDDLQLNNTVAATAKATAPTVYGMGLTAFTGAADAVDTTIADGTTEASIYLFGWSRSDGTWSSATAGKSDRP